MISANTKRSVRTEGGGDFAPALGAGRTRSGLAAHDLEACNV